MTARPARVPILVGLVAVIVVTGVAVLASRGPDRTDADATSSPAASAVPTVADLPCSEMVDPSIGVDEVLVFFSCEPAPADPRPVLRDAPGVAPVEDYLRVALEELLAGPTATELEAGYSSVLPPDSQELLVDVEIRADGLAVIDFADALRQERSLTASTPRFMLFATLGATIFQFDAVTAIEYRIDGSCRRFAGHFETTCGPVLREGGNG